MFKFKQRPIDISKVGFKNEGQPFGDCIQTTRKYALWPKKIENGWVWRQHYYEITRMNAYVPYPYAHEYTETICLDEGDYLIFRLLHPH